MKASHRPKLFFSFCVGATAFISLGLVPDRALMDADAVVVCGKAVEERESDTTQCIGSGIMNKADSARDRSAQMYSIAVVGCGGVGKSALCVRLVSGHFVQRYDPTIDDEYEHTCTLVEGRDPVTLYIWDTSSQVEYAAGMIWPLRKCDGYVLVVASTECSTVRACASLYVPAVRRFCPENTPYVVAINKDDAPAAAQVVDEMFVLQSGMGTSASILRVSAKNDTGVRQLFATLVDMIDAHRLAIRKCDAVASASSGDSAGSPRSVGSSLSNTSLRALGNLSPRGGCALL
jgi:small GTP-binding protein